MGLAQYATNAVTSMPVSPPKLICQNGQEVQALRNRLNLRQEDFWSRIAVKQSAGSRYESGGNPLPLHVAFMVHLAYGTPNQVQKLVEWLRRPKSG